MFYTTCFTTFTQVEFLSSYLCFYSLESKSSKFDFLFVKAFENGLNGEHDYTLYICK